MSSASFEPASYVLFSMLHAGLRISEVVNLSLYDFKNGYLAIREGKGQEARDIPINKTLSLALNEWLVERNKKKPKTNFLIVSQKGGKLTASGIYSLFENVADQTNIINITPHTLIHTFAHDLIDKGFPIMFVAALHGHNDLDTTRIYIHQNNKI